MLIVIRGASGSGKSTLAAQLQQELGWPTAVLGQDHFRRTIYKERQDAGHADCMEHAALLEVAVNHCLSAGQDVVLEGIFQSDRYATMLQRISSTSTDARFYAFNLSFEETLRRHAGRSLASEVSPDQMREWYLGWDPLPFVTEQPILPDEALAAVTRRILHCR
ncbi:AAA domain-containing protein [Curtobacterium sp. PhB130]|uniref:AAA family ATPase n=1 Tax=Curtobacterium sp. PhB130 TaxID=2485178 RepID=UPI000F9A0028|nr:AAA family ATPase [Curtobacterium sp. PhB130]ROS75667.1 AAA domain-containing protein [Curtobacterium sp. PhB130]